MNKRVGIWITPIFALMIFGCEFLYPKSHVTPISSTSLIVYDKCQIVHTIGKTTLKIKAGHFSMGLYKTESGNEMTGLVANLWISDNFKPQSEISIVVHPGQAVIFQDITIHILRVEMDTIGGFVEFEISVNDQSDAPTEKGKMMSGSTVENHAAS